MDYKGTLAEIISTALKADSFGLEKSPDELLRFIEVPKDTSHGDFAFPCFILAKELKKGAKNSEIERLRKQLATNAQKESEVDRLRKLLSDSGVDVEEDSELLQLRELLPANGTATHATASEVYRLRKLLPNSGSELCRMPRATFPIWPIFMSNQENTTWQKRLT